MKLPLSKHKEKLEAADFILKIMKERMESEIQRFNKYQDYVKFYKAQIELAEKEGKDGFDAEKYAFNRIVKVRLK